jgi:hypothetical protein
MESARSHTIVHLIIQQEPALICSDFEGMLDDFDTKVFFHIIRFVRWIGNHFCGTARVLEKITPLFYLAPVLLAWYEIIETILPTFTRFQSFIA